MSYIEIRGLSKRFGSNIVLDNVDMDIEKGDVIALIGPSGTGKSTLLRCLNLLEKPESGTVTIEGRRYDLTTRNSKEINELRSHGLTPRWSSSSSICSGSGPPLRMSWKDLPL